MASLDSAPSLEYLPEELKEMIGAYCAKIDIKNLRLSCRALQIPDSFSSAFFHTIVVAIDDLASLSRLRNILAHDLRARRVREIVFLNFYLTGPPRGPLLNLSMPTYDIVRQSVDAQLAARESKLDIYIMRHIFSILRSQTMPVLIRITDNFRHEASRASGRITRHADLYALKSDHIVRSSTDNRSSIRIFLAMNDVQYGPHSLTLLGIYGCLEMVTSILPLGPGVNTRARFSHLTKLFMEMTSSLKVRHHQHGRSPTILSRFAQLATLLSRLPDLQDFSLILAPLDARNDYPNADFSLERRAFEEFSKHCHMPRLRKATFEMHDFRFWHVQDFLNNHRWTIEELKFPEMRVPMIQYKYDGDGTTEDFWPEWYSALGSYLDVWNFMIAIRLDQFYTEEKYLNVGTEVMTNLVHASKIDWSPFLQKQADMDIDNPDYSDYERYSEDGLKIMSFVKCDWYTFFHVRLQWKRPTEYHYSQFEFGCPPPSEADFFGVSGTDEELWGEEPGFQPLSAEKFYFFSPSIREF